MTIEEAIEHLITVKEYYTSDRDFTPWGEDYEPLLAEEKQAIDKAVETLEKQIPKKPTEYDSVPHARCPQCTKGVRVYCDSAKVPFCQWCGQALDWGDNDD